MAPTGAPGELPPVPDYVPYPKRSPRLITCGVVGAILAAGGVVAMAFLISGSGGGLVVAAFAQMFGLILIAAGMLGVREVFGRVAAFAGLIAICGMGTAAGGASVLADRQVAANPAIVGLMLSGSYAAALAIAFASALAKEGVPSALRFLLVITGLGGGTLGIGTLVLLLQELPNPPAGALVTAAMIGDAATAAALLAVGIVFWQQRRAVTQGGSR